MSSPLVTAPIARPERSLPRGILHGREVLCIQCATPCARQHDATHYSDPASSCPLTPPAWHAMPASARPGDALTQKIEAAVLAPLARAIPAASGIVETVRRCGGCAQARHALGSATQHPDPGHVM